MILLLVSERNHVDATIEFPVFLADAIRLSSSGLELIKTCCRSLLEEVPLDRYSTSLSRVMHLLVLFAKGNSRSQSISVNECLLPRNRRSSSDVKRTDPVSMPTSLLMMFVRTDI